MSSKSMTFVFTLVAGVLSFLCSCDQTPSSEAILNLKKNQATHTYFVQLVWDCSLISTIRAQLPQLVNTILKEELHLHKEEQLFLGKDRNPLSLYYLHDMREQGETIFLSKLEDQQKVSAFASPKHITVAHEVNFFGEWNDELVVMVHDQHDELKHLHETIKVVADKANNHYRETHNTPLYDKQKSEQFPFHPHIGLGRLRSNSIKSLVDKQEEATTVLERIKTRVKDAALKLLNQIATTENKKIVCNKLVVYCLSKRTHLKEYDLINRF